MSRNAILKLLFPSSEHIDVLDGAQLKNPIGMIAGNGNFPRVFAEEAHRQGRELVVLAHRGETTPELANFVERIVWIKVGELGKIISTFKNYGVKQVAMVGGINRIRLFGGVKLDVRGAALLARLGSTKDDVIMRGIARELESEGVEVVPSTIYLSRCYVREGVLTTAKPTEEEMQDVRVGREALQAMSAQDIGQLVVVSQGVVVAVEAVEGSDATIRRGGELGGRGTVVVKFAKKTQDMRFDVPIVGEKTIRSMIEAKSRVLAVEAGKCLILEEDKVIKLAEAHGIAIVGCAG